MASLTATALVAIAVLLFAEFDDTTLKVVATTALLSGFSLLGLPGAALLDQKRAVPLGWLTLGLAAVGLGHALVLLWTGSERGWEVLVTVTAFAGAGAQASGTTARRRTADPRAVAALYAAAIAGAILLATLISIAAWREVEDETYYRVLAALAVLVVALTLLQPILRRTAPRHAAETFRFTCTLEDGAEVPVETEARDFATALASSVTDVERRGRVVRIDRR